MVRLPTIAGAVLLLAGCNTLPGSGPTVSDVQDEVIQDDVVSYMLVDIDARVLDELTSRGSPGSSKASATKACRQAARPTCASASVMSSR
jgi:hypothetical protein